jgi:hypothetical protein
MQTQRHQADGSPIADPGAHRVGVREGANVRVWIIIPGEMLEADVCGSGHRIGSEAKRAMRVLHTRIDGAAAVAETARSDEVVHQVILRAGADAGTAARDGGPQHQGNQELQHGLSIREN